MGDLGQNSGEPRRPCRIANCSGAKPDPGYQMRRQATFGPVDFITGDYLAEVNLANNAENMNAGKHDGWEETAWDGLEQTMDVIKEKRIRIIINGGALNPKGLAQKAQKFSNDRGLDLKIAYVWGDDVLAEVKDSLAKSGLPKHLDSENNKVSLMQNATALLDTKGKPVVVANVYLGARGIVRGEQ
jgi:hypothetical protein